MMSLAEQLKQLQIPGQAFARQSGVKKISLLFDQKTAAGLDNDAILAIGQNGFEELVNIDEVFSQFKEVLFSTNSLHTDRSMQDKTFNKKLRCKISNFLFLLSPYVQLKPAQKCLEWLVRRFLIHVFDKINTEKSTFFYMKELCFCVKSMWSKFQRS